MSEANIKASFPYDIKRVWNVVSSFQDSAWRSDLSKTEIIDEENFVEYAKNNYATSFKITVIKPYERIEFEIENTNIKGYWIGLFSQVDGKTKIDFTEKVQAKKFYLKPLLKIYLKKQQETYVRDLQNALEDSNKNRL